MRKLIKTPKAPPTPATSLLLENEVVELLCSWLENHGWQIKSKALNRTRGYDIHAIRDGQTMLVEAKGARGNPDLDNVCREVFSKSQIESHLGRAIVKTLKTREKEQKATLVIAHPVTDEIMEIVSPVARQLSALGIWFAFVGADGSVQWQEGTPPSLKMVG